MRIVRETAPSSKSRTYFIRPKTFSDLAAAISLMNIPWPRLCEWLFMKLTSTPPEKRSRSARLATAVGVLQPLCARKFVRRRSNYIQMAGSIDMYALPL
jgi:hypothetical protein